ncbi:MAG: NUDIX hydrolase [Microcoleaceae cyanobacterium]
MSDQDPIKSSASWQRIDCFTEIRNPWLTLFGEHWQDERGQILDYWRVEKADSAIALTIYQDQLILPAPMYRPGIDAITLDFPGGRVLPGQTPSQAIRQILQRELKITENNISIATITPLNQSGWAINSAFSNQKLYGFVAVLDPNSEIPLTEMGAVYPHNSTGVKQLLDQLICLQCRAILLEYQSQFF